MSATYTHAITQAKKLATTNPGAPVLVYRDDDYGPNVYRYCWAANYMDPDYRDVIAQVEAYDDNGTIKTIVE